MSIHLQPPRTRGRGRGGGPPGRTRRPGLLLLAAACAASLTACREPGKAGPGGPPEPEVGVVTLVPTRVVLTNELPGRVSPHRIAEVRARVNGIVLKRLFVEGSDVKSGQPLFQIDAAPYRAALASAKAQLARAEAGVVSARLLAQRYAELIGSNAISKQEYDNAVAAEKTAEADVAAGRAAVETATINLGYTLVTSPISGRIGRSAVTEGAYVQAAQATLLATVQQIDPAYVDVTQTAVELLRLRRALEGGHLQRAGREGARVTLLLEDGSTYGATGTLQFSDVTVDPSTGSVHVRALFPNPRRELLPGTFVRARLDEAVDPQALLVPQRGVTRDQKGHANVMVVGEGGKVELRQIETSRVVGESWLVTGGLRPGERVIVDGLQKVRPGVQVKTVPAAATLPPSGDAAVRP